MAGLNKAILIGNLGRDPEMRYSSSGLAVANFTLATNETWTGKDGQKENRTEWHRIVAFGKLAEICGDYLSKGKQVYIEGKIQTREWEDRDGNKRYTTEIVASQMQMLGTRDDMDAPRQGQSYSRPASSQQRREPAQPRSEQPQQRPPQSQPVEPDVPEPPYQDVGDEDIPF